MHLSLCSSRSRLVRPAIAVMAVLALPVAATSQQADFRADVSLVRLNVAVIAPDGEVGPPLTVEDFTVYDDGIRQRIELFLRPTDTPLQVALVLDSSTSMRAVAARARSAALSFLSRLDPADCVFVLPFSHRIGPGRWGAAADPTLRIFLNGVVAGGGTALYDAVLAGLTDLEATSPARAAGGAGSGEEGPQAGELEAAAAPASGTPPDPASDIGAGGLRRAMATALRELPSATPVSGVGCGDPSVAPGTEWRRAVVLLSDGADENSEASFSDLLARARRDSVPVFPVALGFANHDRRALSRLEELARATGGRVIGSTAPGRLQTAYTEVLTYLKSSYVLGYDPEATPHAGRPASEELGEGLPAGAEWHEVRVESRRPTLQVVVRPGYFR